MYSSAGFCPSCHHIKTKNNSASPTQKKVCVSAFLIVIFLFFLLSRPRSNTSAISNTAPNTRYTNWSFVIVRFYQKHFYVPGCRLSVELPLRRTLVQQNMLQQRDWKTRIC